MIDQFIKERLYLKGVSSKTIARYKDSFKAFEGALDLRTIIDRITKLRERGVEPVSINTWLHKGQGRKRLKIPKLKEEPQRWFKELQRSKRMTTGRLDARFTGLDVDDAGERVEYDSSEASYECAYVAGFQEHVRRELRWNSEMYYTVSANVRPMGSGSGGRSGGGFAFGDDATNASEAAGLGRILRPRHAVQRD